MEHSDLVETAQASFSVGVMSLPRRLSSLSKPGCATPCPFNWMEPGLQKYVPLWFPLAWIVNQVDVCREEFEHLTWIAASRSRRMICTVCLLVTHLKRRILSWTTTTLLSTTKRANLGEASGQPSHDSSLKYGQFFLTMCSLHKTGAGLDMG